MYVLQGHLNGEGPISFLKLLERTHQAGICTKVDLYAVDDTLILPSCGKVLINKKRNKSWYQFSKETINNRAWVSKHRYQKAGAQPDEIPNENQGIPLFRVKLTPDGVDMCKIIYPDIV